MATEHPRGKNPFDFQCFVVGVAYQYNEYLRFAIDTQNVLYYHSQFTFPVAEAHQFNRRRGVSRRRSTSSGLISGLVYPRRIHTS